MARTDLTRHLPQGAAPAAPTGARARLLALTERRGDISLAGLSTMIGRNPSYLQQFIRKGSPRKLEEGDRRKLADFLGVSESELGASEDFSGESREKSAFVAIPRLAVSVAAGPGRFADEEAVFDRLGFSARWLRDQGFDPAMLSAVTVEGESMEPLLREGDTILVDRAARTLRDGIHVVRVGEALMVKRVAPTPPDRVRLLSENRAYPPIDVALDELEIIGRVVWKGGRI